MKRTLGNRVLQEVTKGYSTQSTYFSSTTSSSFKQSAQESLDRIDIGFNDPREVYQQKSTNDLVRAYGVFSACRIPPIVKYADGLLKIGKTVLGKDVVNSIVKRTFFNHFCAGETLQEVEQRLQHLNAHGVGGILDYGAEDDVGSGQGESSLCSLKQSDSVIARTYDYESELKCDASVHVFSKSIEAAELQQGQGFAAIKVTALGNPKLLERVSQALTSIKNLFSRFDRNSDGHISQDEFEVAYQELFGPTNGHEIQELFSKLDLLHNGRVDYVSFTDALDLAEMPKLLSRKTASSTEFVALTNEEFELVEAMFTRVGKLAKLAADKNVNLMVDAEHSYFQPAIDHTVSRLQRQYNQEKAVIFNTYQCYLKDSYDRVSVDLERARRYNYVFAAKQVRGAYMVLERLRSNEMGYPSPIHDTLEDTHRNYDMVLEMTLKEVKQTGRAEIMVASHNQKSIELAVDLMNKWELQPRQSGVFFGQLLGMADHLTYTLGRKGYRAYKYVTFGPVEEVMPYLVRRAQENSGMMAGAKFELNMISNELQRRNLSEGQLSEWVSFTNAYLKKLFNPTSGSG